jgi:hypothetical protein
MGCLFLFSLLVAPPPDVPPTIAIGGFVGIIGSVTWLAGKLLEYLNTRALQKKDAETGPVAPTVQVPSPAQLPPNPFDRPSITGTAETIEARVARLEHAELVAAFRQSRWENDDLVRKNADLLVRLEDAYRETDRQRVTVLSERQTAETLRRHVAELEAQVAGYKRKLAGEAADESADTLKPPRRKV